MATTSTSWATVGAVRALVGALVALLFARLRGRSVAPKRFGAIFWRSVLGTVSMLSTFYAVSSRAVSLGNTVTLLNLSPVFLAVLAPIFLRERTSRRVALAIALALGGVLLVVQPAFLFGGSGGPPAALVPTSGPTPAMTVGVAICAALATSFAMMFLRRVGQTESPEAIAFHFSLFATAVFLVIASFDLRVPSPRDAALMTTGGICAGLGQLAMTRAYALETAAKVGGMSYLTVVVSAVLGAFALGERPDATAMLGMALVIGGGLVSIVGPAAGPR